MKTYTVNFKRSITVDFNGATTYVKGQTYPDVPETHLRAIQSDDYAESITENIAAPAIKASKAEPGL